MENTETKTNILQLPKMHEALDRLIKELGQYTKKATLLICEDGTDESDITSTKIGGSKFCTAAQGKKGSKKTENSIFTPLIQINLSDFPELGLKENSGIFQIFINFETQFKDPYLTKDTDGVEIKFIKDISTENIRELTVPDETEKLGPFIIKKEEFLSLPSAHSNCDLPKDHLFMKWNWDKVLESNERLWSVYNYAEGLYIEDKLISRVGGYAPWIEKDQTPVCPVCQNRMKFICAIGTEDTRIDIGDDGYLFAFVCDFTTKCGGIEEPVLVIQTY